MDVESPATSEAASDAEPAPPTTPTEPAGLDAEAEVPEPDYVLRTLAQEMASLQEQIMLMEQPDAPGDDHAGCPEPGG